MERKRRIFVSMLVRENTIDVIVIGGGFSGLSAAYYLQKKGLNVKVFDASGRIGGRAKTDNIEGFQLDWGTHFYHHSTTELKKIIDIGQLGLENIYPGYLLRYNDKFLLYSNPMLKTMDVFPTLLANNISAKDKLRLLGFSLKLKALSYSNIVRQTEMSTYQYLKRAGFAKQAIDSLFKPIISAAIFDRNLQSSSKLSLLFLKSLFNDHVALPKEGIGSIADAMAKELTPASVCLKSRVKNITNDGVEFTDGRLINAKAVVIATNAIDAKKICNNIEISTESTHISTLYFEAEKPPISKPIMMLNANEHGLVNHVFVPSILHENYAPKGKHLIAVNIIEANELDDEELIAAVMVELSGWFGLQVKDWRHIKTYHIKYAMPFKPIIDNVEFSKHIGGNVFYAGDALSIGTMESALRSGRETAENVAQFLKNEKSRQIQEKKTILPE